MAVSAEAITPPVSGHIQGDVVIAAGVAIAPGVVLGAAPGSRLVIAAGVCLGASVVVQAQGGDLVLEPGVSLGSGVLVVGHGAIAQHACIGANSTIVNPKVGPAQVVAPNSLMGDPSPAVTAEPPSAPVADPWAEDLGIPGQSATEPPSSPGVQNGSSQNSTASNPAQVYGRAQVSHLLATLFPQRQALMGSSNGAAPGHRS